MKTITIKSNPYERETVFYMGLDCDSVKEINEITAAKTRLISEDIKHQFFPLKIQEIVQILIDEYGIGDEDGKLELVFRGTLDHYDELKSIVDTLDSSVQIKLEKSDSWLNNAQDVLPEIIQIYENIKPIIELSEKNKLEIKQYTEKFTDASTEQIPLCVIGNYSSGKSTFINSLIGREILPSGDDPVTAKVFKIHQLGLGADTWIEFKLKNESVKIYFRNNNLELFGVFNEEFEQELRMRIDSFQEDKKINETIKYLNNINVEDIDPIIKLGIEFKGGIWNQCNNRFVILDTPGSNSASNIEHSQVLDMALEGLTNGLPLYVTENNKLDSLDNLALYQKIKSMKEIDSRFTMIIVNKADDCDLPEVGYYSKKQENNILSQAIPKNMYSLGIYYISSIMGLGSKNEEHLVNNHSKRTFKKNKIYFMGDDPVSHLYLYNIMPRQIKEASLLLCDEYEDDPIYVNSGLYSVEQGIQNFANKYSSYNKCKQSIIYLNKIIDLVDDEIKENTGTLEKQRKKINEEMDEKRKILKINVQRTKEEKEKMYIKSAEIQFEEYARKQIPQSEKSFIKELQNTYTEKHKELYEFGEQEKKVSDSVDKMIDNLKKGVDEIKVSQKFDTVGNILSDFFVDMKAINKNVEDKKKTQNAIDDDTTKIVIQDLKDKINEESNLYFESMIEESKKIWIDKADQIRNDLAEVVMESDALNEDKKLELRKLIMNFEDIIFKKIDESILENEKYLKVFNRHKLNVSYLNLDINRLYSSFGRDVNKAIFLSDSQSFKEWLDILEQTLLANLSKYNEILYSLQKELDEKNEAIDHLKQMKTEIEISNQKIKSLMEWQS